MLHLHPAATRAHLRDRDGGGVVKVDGGLGQGPQGVGQPQPVLVRQAPLAHGLHGHVRLAAEHAVGQLLARHLQGEEGHGLARDHGRVLRDVEHEGGLAHRRARADEDELAAVEARGQPVQLRKARGHALDAALVEVGLLDVGIGRHQRGLDVHQRVRGALHGDVVDLLFGVVQDLRDGLFLRVALRGDRVAGADHAPQHALFLHNARIGLRVGRRGHGPRQRRQVRQSADALHAAGAVELLGHGHKVHRPPRRVQRAHRREDRPVHGGVEVIRHERLHGHHDRLAREHHRAQQRLFRVLAVRRHTPFQFHIHPCPSLDSIPRARTQKKEPCRNPSKQISSVVYTINPLRTR